MPKEITHWLIAEKAASLLKGSILEKDPAAHPQCLRLGAVFPDILFFLVGKSPVARLSELAYALHGTGGEDTYSFLRALLSGKIEKAESGPLTAFWVGVASHLRSDITFHPFVYYVTGNYHHTDPAFRSIAVQRHRRFETLMDMYFNRDERGRQTRKHSLREIVDGQEIPLPRLFQIASQSLAEISGEEPKEIEIGLHKGLKTFILLQDLCCRPVLGRFLFALEKALPGPLREVTALFEAPQLASHFKRLAEPMRYLNPVSGKPGETTVDALFRKASRDCADFCKKLEDAIIKRSPAALKERGPSLSFALPGVTTDDARFFSDRDFLSE